MTGFRAPEFQSSLVGRNFAVREDYGEERVNMLGITAKIRSDGKVVEVLPGGGQRVFPDTPMRPMTEEEIKAAATADPDARPMTPEQLRTARRVPRTKTLRRALRLTQEEFAARYRIPIGTLRDWEQGRCEPDQPAQAYLAVIARDPEGVRRALQAQPA